MYKTFCQFSIIVAFLLTACGQDISSTDSAISTPRSTTTTTQTPLPSSTPTATIKLLPTFTPTLNELVQLNPFPTSTPDHTTIVFTQKWNTKNFLLSPDRQWGAIADIGVLRIVQVNGDQERIITCETFIRCEFIIPLQWSPDSQILYVVPLLTGEFLVTFPLNTGIGRIDVKTGRFEKLVEDGISEGDYNASLSPDGNYISITDTRESPPSFIIMETKNLQEIIRQKISITLDPHDHGPVIGNMIWTHTKDGIVFLAQSTNSISSVLYYDIETKTVSIITDKDPSFIELLFINKDNRVALSKTTYYPFSKSYWYLDLSTKEFIPISPTP